MKLQMLFGATAAIVPALWTVSCQKEYVDGLPDIPTDKIDYISLTASQDSARMFEPIVIKAVARGEDLQFKWQKNKGSLVLDNDSTARFWGCPTCLNWVTVSCTVSNQYGRETKEVRVFIKDEMYEQP